MIEPTESESKADLDRFIEAMKAIALEAQNNPDLLLEAPNKTFLGRLDETRANREPKLRWEKN